jgi:hypothetical protein
VYSPLPYVVMQCGWGEGGGAPLRCKTVQGGTIATLPESLRDIPESLRGSSTAVLLPGGGGEYLSLGHVRDTVDTTRLK